MSPSKRSSAYVSNQRSVFEPLIAREPATEPSRSTTRATFVNPAQRPPLVSEDTGVLRAASDTAFTRGRMMHAQTHVPLVAAPASPAERSVVAHPHVQRILRTREVTGKVGEVAVS